MVILGTVLVVLLIVAIRDVCLHYMDPPDDMLGLFQLAPTLYIFIGSAIYFAALVLIQLGEWWR